ncbi:MAG: N-acetylmuramoyl-L-alanine amidase [Bdellovibrionales bacterium]|nr:N-acetylmuramoyl-L-alanine amidase [Bdellovibrionales bacterium]
MGKPRRSLTFLLIGLTAAATAEMRGAFAGAPKASDYTVVLDPGHGGTDFGAIYAEKKSAKSKKGKTVFTEKAAVLGLAIEAKRQLEQKGYPVLLTRDRDADIALNARTAIANRAHAKVFVSIHMNSLPSGRAEGVETYLLNSTTDRTSKRLAELENKGLDPTQGSKQTSDTEVNLILKDMTIDGNAPESKRLACALQDHLTAVTKQRPRGVKQALFVVLLGADMPTSLVEAGFVSSERDRKLITSEHGVRAMAAAMVRAIEQFRTRQGTEAARQDQAKCLVSDH